MKYVGNGRFDRRILNLAFGQKNARPDAECWELEAFVVNTMCGNGWDCKGVLARLDFIVFCEEFGIRLWPSRVGGEYQPTVWPRWLGGSAPEEDKWAVVEKRDGVTMWCWFQKSMQISDWVPLDQDSLVTKKVVPFKNGFFKSVPL